MNVTPKSDGSGMVTVVTPTYRRAQEVVGLLKDLAKQRLIPFEVILVDGAPDNELETENLVLAMSESLPFTCRHIRHARGTAIQRNAGIEAASGRFVALIDDDVRMEPDFLEKLYAVFSRDAAKKIGGVVGYRTNQHFDLESRQRWRWYRRLRLLTVYEPGRYDFRAGYPINANMQPRFSGVREVDFMTTACAMWRREVFESGLRFDPFFRDYGVLEDAHFSLKAGRVWKLLQCGDACCQEMHASTGRENRRRIGHKCVVNYYYVFRDIAGPLTWRQEMRFWRFQAFELFRIAASAVRRRRWSDVNELRGRLEGIVALSRGTEHHL